VKKLMGSFIYLLINSFSYLFIRNLPSKVKQKER